MPSGFKYNLTPKPETVERYAVRTGERRIGAFTLVTDNLEVGSTIAPLTPMYADFKTRYCYPVRNVKVVEDYATGDANLAIKVSKKSLSYPGMFIGDGAKGAKVVSVDKSNAMYDTLNIEAAFGANLKAGDVLFEATAVGGTKQKYIANSGLFENWKVESGINLVTLLRRAAEIEPLKLDVPYSSNDKSNLQGLFEFNE